MTIKKILNCIVSLLYIGYIKGGGTWATIITYLIYKNIKFNFIFLFFLQIFFFLIVYFFLKFYKIPYYEDPSYIVIDESSATIFGIYILDIFDSLDYEIYFLILFRIIDIKKLFFAKKIEKIGGFLGIMLDDYYASILSLIIILLYKILFNMIHI